MALPMRWLVRCGRPERGDWRECGPMGQRALERLHLHAVQGRPLVVDHNGERRSVFRSDPYPSLDGADCYAFTLDCMQYYEYDKSDQRVRMLWKTPPAAWQRKRGREAEQNDDEGPNGPECVEYERVLAYRLRKRLLSYGKNCAATRDGEAVKPLGPDSAGADTKGHVGAESASDSSVVDGASGDEERSRPEMGASERL